MGSNYELIFSLSRTRSQNFEEMHSHLDVCKDRENTMSTRIDQRKLT